MHYILVVGYNFYLCDDENPVLGFWNFKQAGFSKPPESIDITNSAANDLLAIGVPLFKVRPEYHSLFLEVTSDFEININLNNGIFTYADLLYTILKQLSLAIRTCIEDLRLATNSVDLSTVYTSLCSPDLEPDSENKIYDIRKCMLGSSNLYFVSRLHEALYRVAHNEEALCKFLPEIRNNVTQLLNLVAEPEQNAKTNYFSRSEV